MSAPTTLDEYNERYQLASKIDGFGFSVSMTLPCPFCCEPGFWKYYVLHEGAEGMREVCSKEAVCKACGRGAKLIFTGVPGSGSVGFTCVQTRGDDPPAFLPKMRRA